MSLSLSSRTARNLVWATACICASFGIASAQPSKPVEQFEVASIRQSRRDHGYTQTGPWNTDGFSVKSANLNYIVQIAYGVHSNLIAGLPSWADEEAYDIDARTADGTKLDWQQVRRPLQALLQQRLHLATHWEQRETSGYELVATHPKLQASKREDQAAGYIFEDHLVCPNIEMEGLASMLQSLLRKPVVNKTGLTGLYHLDLKFRPTSNPESSLPDIFTAIQEQLGLKLVAAKVRVRYLVVDHVDRVPTEN